MPTTTGVQADVLASTLRILRDKEVDNTFKIIPLLDAIERGGNVETVDGGSYIDSPVILTDHSTITQLSSGYEAVSLAVKDPMRTASYSWCDATAPVVITRKEELSNKGERAIVRIAEARLKQTMGMFKREIEKQLIAGSSTILTDLQTLNGLDGATGWFEEGAFGSQANTVGGIDKSSFTTSWQNQVQDGAFSANGLKKMQSLLIDCQQFAPEGDVDLILASPTSYGLYKDQLQQLERYVSATEERNMAGRLALQFNGAAMFIEPNLGFTGSGGSNKMSMYFLNTKLFNCYFDRDAKFELGDMESISGYAAMSAQIAVRMQICTSNLSGHGILVNAES
tara:strand:- start:1412 stop:2428 length:1017 start_codon:yes stop_codon:yes gene_type:complete